VFLRPAGRPAKHLRDEIFEACRGNAVMSLIYPWICVESGINHDPVDEVVHHSGDAVDTTKPIIKAERNWWPFQRRRCFKWRFGFCTPLETFIVAPLVAFLVALSLTNFVSRFSAGRYRGRVRARFGKLFVPGG